MPDRIADYHRRINAATNHVAQNLDKSHSIEDLAEISNFSKFHFHRIYRALTGETVTSMVNRLRLEGAAATLIYKKNLPVTRVAVDHGYSSGANFTRAFTKHFGCSPSAYRSNSKIGKDTLVSSADHSHFELEVKVKRLPEVCVAYYRRKGAYLHNEISSMHDKVQKWVADRECVASEPASIGITWSDSLITDEENWIYDAGVAVQPGTKGDGEISIQLLEGGLVAQLDVELGPSDSHDLSPYWDWLVRDWLLAGDHELRPSPSFELYLAVDDNFKVRLCLPVFNSIY